MNGNIKAHVPFLINTPCSENALLAPRSVCVENLWANTLTNDLFQLCGEIFAVPACQKH